MPNISQIRVCSADLAVDTGWDCACLPLLTRVGGLLLRALLLGSVLDLGAADLRFLDEAFRGFDLITLTAFVPFLVSGATEARFFAPVFFARFAFGADDWRSRLGALVVLFLSVIQRLPSAHSPAGRAHVIPQ